MSRTTYRLAAAVGTLLATAALASSASADPHAQDTHMRELQAAGKTTPHVVQDLRSPDARDAARAAGPYHRQDLRSPDARDAAERRAPTIVRVDRSPRSGISWDSAGIGALVSAGIMFSLVGAFVLVTRRRTRGVHTA
jgi:hypothetical protein